MKPSEISQRLTKNAEEEYSISIYNDEILNENIYKEQSKKLALRFENMRDPQYSLLMFHTLENANFTNNRFRDAVEFVIGNHNYPTIYPADIIKYDKCLELKTNLWMRQQMQTFGSTIWQYYDTVNVNGQCMYVAKGMQEKYNIFLPEWKPKKYRPAPPTEKEIEAVKDKFDFSEVVKDFVDRAKNRPLRRSKYQGKKMTAEEIIAAANKNGGKQ